MQQGRLIESPTNLIGFVIGFRFRDKLRALGFMDRLRVKDRVRALGFRDRVRGWLELLSGFKGLGMVWCVLVRFAVTL